MYYNLKITVYFFQIENHPSYTAIRDYNFVNAEVDEAEFKSFSKRTKHDKSLQRLA